MYRLLCTWLSQSAVLSDTTKHSGFWSLSVKMLCEFGPFGSWVAAHYSEWEDHAVMAKGFPGEIHWTPDLYVFNTMLCGVVNTLERRDASQGYLDKLQKWACVNLMRFDQAKCKVLHVDRGNSCYKYRLGDEGIESSPAEKDLGVKSLT